MLPIFPNLLSALVQKLESTKKGRFACPGEIFVLECHVNGSRLSWTYLTRRVVYSQEQHDTIGTARLITGNVSSLLVNFVPSSDGRTSIFTSFVTIVVSMSIQNTVITCSSDTDSKMFTLKVAETPAAPAVKHGLIVDAKNASILFLLARKPINIDSFDLNSFVVNVMYDQMNRSMSTFNSEVHNNYSTVLVSLEDQLPKTSTVIVTLQVVDMCSQIGSATLPITISRGMLNVTRYISLPCLQK